jgi:hypothetical protein
VTLSAEHRKFLIIDQGVVPTVFNLLLNGLIAWALFRSAEAVPLWGESSIAVDLLATAFLLPFLTCLIVSALVGRHVRHGKVEPLRAGELPHSRWFTRPAIARATLLGGIGVFFGAVPLVWALSLGSSQPFAVYPFVMFKAVWAAMLAAVLTPIVGWWALASASRQA